MLVSKMFVRLCLIDITTFLLMLYEQLSSRGTVNTLYFLKPQNKTRSRLLKKLLGLKPSKKRPKIPLFRVSMSP